MTVLDTVYNHYTWIWNPNSDVLVLLSSHTCSVREQQRKGLYSGGTVHPPTDHGGTQVGGQSAATKPIIITERCRRFRNWTWLSRCWLCCFRSCARRPRRRWMMMRTLTRHIQHPPLSPRWVRPSMTSQGSVNWRWSQLGNWAVDIYIKLLWQGSCLRRAIALTPSPYCLRKSII